MIMYDYVSMIKFLVWISSTKLHISLRLCVERRKINKGNGIVEGHRQPIQRNIGLVRRNGTNKQPLLYQFTVVVGSQEDKWLAHSDETGRTAVLECGRQKTAIWFKESNRNSYTI